MNGGRLQTVGQARQSLGVSESVECKGLVTREKHYCIERVLPRFNYHLLKGDERVR